MKTIGSTYINALLADASYVVEIAGGAVNASLFQTRLTSSQANHCRQFHSPNQHRELTTCSS